MIEPTVLPICEGPAYGGEVEWGQNPPEDTAEGLLSQIDNMVCGLTRKEAP